MNLLRKVFVSIRFIIFLGHKDVVRILIKKNANVNAEDEGKVTPLHIAAIIGNSTKSFVFEL